MYLTLLICRHVFVYACMYACMYACIVWNMNVCVYENSYIDIQIHFEHMATTHVSHTLFQVLMRVVL